MSNVRVRFAPSPTGPLHMGGVRTALYNYLYAKKQKGDFIIRVEDTDQSRCFDEAEDYIYDALDWCGLNPDEGPHVGGEYGPYRQSERKEQYQKYVQQLVDSGHAYYAFDTPEELDEMRERMKKQGVPNPQYNAVTRSYMQNSLTLPENEVKKRLERGDEYVVRIKVPRKEEVKVKDEIRGWVAFHSGELDDKVLLKADGMPTYHMANVVDDKLMEISHVIRGEEWLPSTPIHVLLYRYLGWEEDIPVFAHLPLILRPDGKGKLSKRAAEEYNFPIYPLNWDRSGQGQASIGYREAGFLPAGFINALALLGWNPGTDEEIFTLKELIEKFSVDRVGKAGAKFDYDKAKWINQQHLKQKPGEELVRVLKEKGLGDLLQEQDVSTDEKYLARVAELLKERLTLLSPQEFWERGRYFFFSPESYDEKTIKKKWKEETTEIFETIHNALIDVDASVFTSDTIEETVESVRKDYDVGKGKVLPILRLALTGVSFGPPIYEIAALIGKEQTIERLATAIQEIPAKVPSDS